MVEGRNAGELHRDAPRVAECCRRFDIVRHGTAGKMGVIYVASLFFALYNVRHASARRAATVDESAAVQCTGVEVDAKVLNPPIFLHGL